MKCLPAGTVLLALAGIIALPGAGATEALAQVGGALGPEASCRDRPAETVASFEDPGLARAVAEALGVASTAELTCARLAGIETLSVGGAGIRSLVGIQNLVRLRELEAGDNAITDIGSLRSLTQLTTLGLFSNDITDVGALRDLPGLVDVRLQSNRGLRDLGPLLDNPGLGEGDRLGVGSTYVRCTDLTLLASRLVTIDAIQTPELFCDPPTALPDEPLDFPTYEHPLVRAEVVVRGLSHPWGMAFLPDGGILVTERPGRLRLVRAGVLASRPIAGVPDVMGGQTGIAGLLDVELHPDFGRNRLVYLTYSKATGAGATIALARGRFEGEALHDVEDVFVAEPWGRRVDYAGSRVVFAPDGTLYLTVGGAFGTVRALARDPAQHVGKVLRLNDDGSVPSDNPFVGVEGYAPEIFSMGHRNQQGAAVHPVTGVLWASEHAPQGGDEVNVILPGRDYGWPDVSYAREYVGPRVAEHPYEPGFERPALVWLPSIAATGMTFYTGDRFPAWKNNLFVGGMLTGRIRGTGHVERIALNPNGEELRREWLLEELQQRVRDVAESPDGFLYVLTDHPDDGGLVRIEPAR